MNLKNLLLPIVLFSGYYFIQVLGTTNKIAQTPQELSTSSIQPNLLEKLAIDGLQNYKTKDDYFSFFQQEESRIWLLIKETLNISLSDCNKIKKNWHTYYLKDSKELQEINKKLPELSKETIALIHSVMKDFEIDQDDLVILPFADYCPAAVDDYTLYINEPLFNSLTQKAQKFCIAHEFQHFILKDDSTNYVLLQHCDKDKADLPAEHPLNQISRLQELRADVRAALKGIEYAQGFKEFTQKAIEIIGEGEGSTHPKNSLRLSYAEQIISKAAYA